MMRRVKVIYIWLRYLVTYNSSRGMFPTSTSVQIDNIISIGPDFIKVSMKVDHRLIYSMVIQVNWMEQHEQGFDSMLIE